MVPKQKSAVWQYFCKTDEKTAKCKLCQKSIKSSGNTTNLIGHIKNCHKSYFFESINNKNESGKKQTECVAPTPSCSRNADVIEIDIQTNDIEDSSKNANKTSNEIETLHGYFDVVPIKRQKTIESSFRDVSAFSETGEKTGKLNNCLLYMICKDNQPFSIVENVGFKNLMKTLAPHYKIPSRTTLRRWLDQKYDAIAEVFKKKLSTIENITLTTDIWSDKFNMKSFLGVTAHFGIGIELCSVSLGVYEMDERHTSQYISDMLLKTCQEWGIEKERLTAVVTDNAPNMVKAINLTFGEEKHISCFAHTLNLVAESTIACVEWQRIISKIKAIVAWFKKSCIASDELRKATTDETKLIQSVPTRWNSTYYMIQRFLELRTAVNDILFRYTNAPPMLTGLEITAASSVLLILRPIEAATKEICGDTYCTSSKIIPLVHCMVSKIHMVEPDTLVARNVKKLALEAIAKKMGAIEDNSLLAIANILDPRFKKIHFKDMLACSSAIEKIKVLMEASLNNTAEFESDSDLSMKSNEETFSLWSDHQNLVHRNWKTNKSDGTLSDELSIYLSTPVSRLNENPLVIWEDIKIQFPKVYKTAYKFLTMVGSSVPSERLFSKAAQVMNQERNRLKGKRLSKILFLQSLDKKYWEN